jgi:tetratricopeptide (TPR) repeat protein
MAKKYIEAIADSMLALSLNPDTDEVHAGLGDSCLGKKQYRDADLHYCKAIAINPMWAYALNNLGVCLERQGKLKDAALAYKAALLVDPQLKGAKEHTKSALDRYLGSGFGSIAFLLWCIIKLATTSSLKTEADSILFLALAGAVGVLVLSYWYRYCQKLDRRNELALDDPELLDIYEKIKQEKQQ